jgi:hypothetical protein
MKSQYKNKMYMVRSKVPLISYVDSDEASKYNFSKDISRKIIDFMIFDRRSFNWKLPWAPRAHRLPLIGVLIDNPYGSEISDETKLRKKIWSAIRHMKYDDRSKIMDVLYDLFKVYIIGTEYQVGTEVTYYYGKPSIRTVQCGRVETIDKSRKSMAVANYTKIMRHEECMLAGDYYGEQLYGRVVYYEWDKQNTEIFTINRDYNMLVGSSDHLCEFHDY